PLLFAKEILVQSLEFNDAIAADTHAVFDHQISQFLAVNEDHTLCQILDVVARWLTEGGCGDEHSFGGAQADETTNKTIDIWAAHRVAGRVAFRLNIDAV